MFLLLCFWVQVRARGDPEDWDGGGLLLPCVARSRKGCMRPPCCGATGGSADETVVAAAPKYTPSEAHERQMPPRRAPHQGTTDTVRRALPALRRQRSPAFHGEAALRACGAQEAVAEQEPLRRERRLTRVPSDPGLAPPEGLSTRFVRKLRTKTKRSKPGLGRYTPCKTRTDSSDTPGSLGLPTRTHRDPQIRRLASSSHEAAPVALLLTLIRALSALCAGGVRVQRHRPAENTSQKQGGSHDVWPKAPQVSSRSAPCWSKTTHVGRSRPTLTQTWPRQHGQIHPQC